MILVGQYDSPFVRRVAIALHHYGLPFERRVISVFQDFEAMLAIHNDRNVPVRNGARVESGLVLEVLTPPIVAKLRAMISQYFWKPG